MESGHACWSSHRSLCRRTSRLSVHHLCLSTLSLPKLSHLSTENTLMSLSRKVLIEHRTSRTTSRRPSTKRSKNCQICHSFTVGKAPIGTQFRSKRKTRYQAGSLCNKSTFSNVVIRVPVAESAQRSTLCSNLLSRASCKMLKKTSNWRRQGSVKCFSKWNRS